MTEGEINYQFNKISERVQLLYQAADNIENGVANTLQQLIGNIDKAWDGVNSREYIQLCKKEYRKVNDTVRKIREAAKTINEIAENAKNSELAALAAAQIIETLFGK